MIARYRPTIKPPFSLRDRTVQEIAGAGTSVCLFFGEGSLTIEGVDPDFMAVLLLRPEKERGAFEGKRTSLKHFLERYHEYSFKLVDEPYEDHALTHSGYLALPDGDNLIEMSLEVYYSSGLVYDTESWNGKPCETHAQRRIRTSLQSETSKRRENKRGGNIRSRDEGIQAKSHLTV